MRFMTNDDLARRLDQLEKRVDRLDVPVGRGGRTPLMDERVRKIYERDYKLDNPPVKSPLEPGHYEAVVAHVEEHRRRSSYSDSTGRGGACKYVAVVLVGRSPGNDRVLWCVIPSDPDKAWGCEGAAPYERLEELVGRRVLVAISRMTVVNGEQGESARVAATGLLEVIA